MARANRRVGSGDAAARVLAAALLLFGAAGPAAANSSMDPDFTSMMNWLGNGMAQGLAFNAGETFDPPREITDHRLQPDISLGYGELPLNKSQFPQLQTQALATMSPQSIFPSTVGFPNLVAHFRAGLPWRSDFALRLANMTSPPGYKISPTTTADAQSNSIGFSLRKHFGGGENPLFSLGLDYNHVYGHVTYNSSFGLSDIGGSGLNTTMPILGGIQWNLNSMGVNAIVSQPFGSFTPFGGVGYSYVTGSVHTSLEADSDTFLVQPTIGSSTNHPSPDQGRLLGGFELEGSWLHYFVSGELKEGGVDSGKSWIVQAGLTLPIHIGVSRDGSASARQRDSSGDNVADDGETDVYRAPAAPSAGAVQAPKREKFTRSKSDSDANSDLIFLQ